MIPEGFESIFSIEKKYNFKFLLSTRTSQKNFTISPNTLHKLNFRLPAKMLQEEVLTL
jgi:hypothetical protein